MKFKINNFKVATKLLLFSTNFYAITSMASPMNQYSNELQSVLSGSITDEAGNPLAGATIHVKGTPKSTASDQNGIFKLNNVKKNEVISIHMIGFTTQEVRYNSETTLNIKMISVAQSLEEAVVVGYGTIDKKELTSAVSTIKQKDMVAGTVSPLLAIQGKVPGLSVISTNGTDPNAGISLQLRGVNSVNASQGPLVVIDGVPGGDINSVAKEDIESINVLRDASAAAIYGTRASGGVILITTKRPQIGKAQVNFTSEYFIETVRKKPEVLSAEKFIEYGLGNDLGHKTDWYDEVTNNNPFSHRQVVNISGGSENANVYTTFTKRDATGMAITSKREEIGGRINSSFKFFDGFTELNTNVSYNEAKAFGSNNDIFNMAMVLNPTETPYDVNDVSGFNVLVGGYDYWNPVAEVKLRSDLKQFKYLLANSTLKLNLTEHLTTSATIGVKNNSEHGTYYRSAQHRLSRQDGVDGNASQYYNKYNDRVFEWTVNYNNRWADHAVNAVAGYSYQDFNGQGFSANNSDFPVDGIKENDMGTGSYLVEGRAGMGSWRNPWVN
ncbi:TonB-dependent receptor (fragment) [Sphingobacterium sp. PM2-P1-29]